MAVLEINGNFQTEKAKSNERFNVIKTEIGKIEVLVGQLKTAWQDEKSAKFIQEIDTYTSEMKTQLETARSNAEGVFTELNNILKIYQDI